MAYNYLTDGGGTRFRVAYNQRTIGPIRVQDYRNLKPNATFTPLDSLPNFLKAANCNNSLLLKTPTGKSIDYFSRTTSVTVYIASAFVFGLEIGVGKITGAQPIQYDTFAGLIHIVSNKATPPLMDYSSGY